MTKRVTVIALVLTALFSLILLLGQRATAQESDLPPLGDKEIHVMFPPGTCIGIIELGTWKKELSEAAGYDVFWARSPRQFVEPCEIIAMKEWTARYRLAVRCVRRDNLAVYSSWVRSLSGLKQPWPAICEGFAPGQPINPELCP